MGVRMEEVNKTVKKNNISVGKILKGFVALVFWAIIVVVALALVLTLAALFFASPLVLVFVLNTLFGFTLQYTWATWLACWGFFLCLPRCSSAVKVEKKL